MSMSLDAFCSPGRKSQRCRSALLQAGLNAIFGVASEAIDYFHFRQLLMVLYR